MKKCFLLLLLFISVQCFSQVKEKLSGKWKVTNAADPKEKKEIEFKFEKDGDYIIISSKKKGSSSSNKNRLSVFEGTTTIVYMSMTSDFKLSSHNYTFTFLSDDVLELKNKDDANEVITLDRKK